MIPGSKIRPYREDGRLKTTAQNKVNVMEVMITSQEYFEEGYIKCIEHNKERTSTVIAGRKKGISYSPPGRMDI